MTTPLDPREGARYTEPVKEDIEDENIGELYNITVRREDYVNPTSNGELGWRSICSYDTDSKDVPERWQNRLHEVSSSKCACVIKYVRWIGTEIQELPRYDATRLLSDFFYQMKTVYAPQMLFVLDVVLKGTLVRWWATHKGTIDNWNVAAHMLQQCFEKSRDNLTDLY